MAILVKDMFRWNKCSKNADISVLSNLLAIFSNFFDIEKFYQVLSTHKISDQLDYSNRNYRGGGGGGAESAIPICKKPDLFRVKLVSFYSNSVTPENSRCLHFASV